MTVPIETLAGDEAAAFRAAIKPHMMAILTEENLVPAPDLSDQLAAVSATLDAKVLLAGRYANAVGDVDIPGAPAGERSSYYFAGLSGAIANADTDADVPGFPAGYRGARFWSLQSGASAVVAGGHATSAATAAASADADAAATAADRTAVANDKTAVNTLAGQVAADRAATAGFAASAQAISFASSIDSKGNLVIGTGAAGPNDVVGNSDGNGVSLGTSAGVGQSQTYSRKPVNVGVSSGINLRGYAVPAIGAYTGARAVSDYAAYFGTHSGQDMNQTGRVVPGLGARATGSVTFTAVPTAGDTVTVNGVVFTCAAVPANSYQFAPGASAAEAAKNLLRCLLAVTDNGIMVGYYRLDSTTATAVNIAASGVGAYGNGFTLAKAGANITVSGATLTGGTDYTNGGNPVSVPGEVTVGFAAGGGTSRSNVRRATVTGTFSGNPADGDFFKLGFSLAKTITFKNAPAGALDVQRGADVAETLANTLATLNGSADTTVDDVTYWGRANTLFIEHDSTNVNTFEVRSWTAALAFDWRAARGGLSNLGPNTVLGWNSMVQSVTAGSIALGYSSGSASTGNNRVTFGNAGASGNGSGVFAWGISSLNYVDGDDVVALGNGISSGQADTYQSITAVAIDGTVTFAAPHGWRVGNIYAGAWRDNAASGAKIQRTTPSGSASWADMPAALGGVIFQVINPMQVQFIDGSIPSANTGGRNYDYRATGTVANLQVTRYVRTLERSTTIGSDAVARSYTLTFGHSSYRGGVQIDAIGLNLAAGDLRYPSVIPGTWANGRITFPTNFANNETISFTDGTSTFTMTAKDAASFNAITTGMQNWFEIDPTSVFRTIRNLLIAIRNNDDQATARRVLNRMRFWITAATGSPSTVSLNWQALDTNTPALSLSTTRGDATVIVTSTGTLGNLPIATSTNPPNDGGYLQITSSPIRNGGPGLAQWSAATARWNLV